MGEIQERAFFTKNGKEYVVRTVFPEDANRVVPFIRTVICEAPFLIITKEEYKITVEKQKQSLEQMVEDTGKIAILAECDGDIIGFLDFLNGSKQRNNHQGAFGMSVRKDFRNQGIGKALVSVLIDWVKENTLIEKICLGVFADNINAISLYKKLGFVEEGLKKRAIKINDQTYHDLILMAIFIK